MSSVDTSNLVTLAANTATKYRYDNPGPDLLETFASPFADPKLNRAGGAGTVYIEVPEFTSICPVSGQPDFATIVIDYRPAALCVESKSLKLYMMAYRNTGEFHEACVTRILNDLVQVLKPVYMRVTGRFTPRGGIPFHPTVAYHRDDSGTDPLPGLFDAEVPGA